MLKLMIAYIVLHYDIKPLDHRPENISFGDASIPSFTTTIMVRRRKAVHTDGLDSGPRLPTVKEQA